MVKYLILGDGFLGRKLFRSLDNSMISGVRIKSPEDALDEIGKYNPEIVINCIGKTGRPNIDWCESHKKETFDSNVAVPAHILRACHESQKRMIHIGSGCVYQGDNSGAGFSEKDTPNFSASYYSQTKIWAERLLNLDDVLQMRIRMPLDSVPSPRNLIDKLKGYKKVLVVPNSITVVDDFLRIAKILMDEKSTGIYNIVNKHPITHDKLLELYREAGGNVQEYETISASQLDAMTLARRSNCILSTEKLEKLDIYVPNSLDSARECLKSYVKNERSIAGIT